MPPTPTTHQAVDERSRLRRAVENRGGPADPRHELRHVSEDIHEMGASRSD
ncbi:hypothetical protein ACFQH6_02075 [Halobacteriaceae archaeon GCM10025711]